MYTFVTTTITFLIIRNIKTKIKQDKFYEKCSGTPFQICRSLL